MYVIVYMDDGPRGACGQDFATTSPHTRVYIFDSEEEGRDWLVANYKEKSDRKRSRFAECFPFGHVSYSYCNALECSKKITDKLELFDALVDVLVDVKWEDCGPLAAYKPDGERSITRDSLFKALARNKRKLKE